MKKMAGRTLAILLAFTLLMTSGCIVAGQSTPLPGGATQTPGATTIVTPAPVLTPPVTSVAPGTGTPLSSSWTPPATTTSGTDLASMVEVVRVIRPSVVAIDVSIRGFDFFNQPVTERGSGSGVIIDAGGIIVTNNHVVENATNVVVTLYDGRVFPGTQVATDPVTDLAVVRINAAGLPAARFGDSGSLEVGQEVAVVGNALGEGISMTGGFVSQLNVSITDDNGQTLYDLIRTDAAINPGNSGGPLVNKAGEVVGITNAKLVATGIENVGFAISAETALPIIQDLVTKGSVVYPFMGLSLRTVDQAVASQYNLGVDWGALITNITRGGPSEQAGLAVGDVIVNMNGAEITSADDAVRIIRRSQIGQRLPVTYYRGNNRLTTDVTLAQRPS